MKKDEKGLGDIFYTEWMFLLRDYYKTLKKSEIISEIVFPVGISVICTSIYYSMGKMLLALNKLADLLPSAISILIGFTIMLITLLLTSSGDNVEILKGTYIDKKLYNKNINLFQGLHIQFTHTLFSEIFLLILIFAYLFFSGIGISKAMQFVFLIIQIYLILNILISILRGITNVYFSFFKY